MQLASFFSTSAVEQSYGYVHSVDASGAEHARESLIHSSRYFDCTRCSWKSTIAAAEIPVTIGSEVPSVEKSLKPSKLPRRKVKRANFSLLNDDILLEVIEYLDTKSLLIFAKLYDRVARLVRDTNVRPSRFYCSLISQPQFAPGDSQARNALLRHEARSSRNNSWSWPSISPELQDVYLHVRLYVEVRFR